MPDREKEKDSYKVLWKKACDAVDGFNLAKMQKAQNVKVKEAEIKPTKPPEKPKTDKMKSKNTSKMAEKKNVGKTQNKGKSPEPPKQKQFSAEEVDAGIKRLCDSFPMLFNLNEPKPLKIGIDENIKLVQSDWDIDLLKAVMRKYVRMESYILNTITMKYRYDLQGKENEKIDDGGREHGIKQLTFSIGRLALAEKYPEYVSKNINIHEPTEEKSYGTLYYAYKVKEEVYRILLDCYGRKGKSKFNIDVLEDGKRRCRLTITSHKGEEVIIESTICDDRKKASINCYKRALVRLQNTIQAYSFEYAKPKMKEEDIIR